MARIKVNEQFVRAYKAAGWDISASGKAIAPLSRQSPSAPGFSRLPEPTGFSRLPEPRSTVDAKRTKPAPTVPYRVGSISEIPEKLIPLYTSDGAGFVRGPHGAVLASYRDAKAKDPLAAPITRRATLTKNQWATLLAVAEPGPEREHFLRDAALKRLTIED